MTIPLSKGHHSNKPFFNQIRWSDEVKNSVWSAIISEKIKNQAFLLESKQSEKAALLEEYAKDVMPGDPTNREGHAAKVYFNEMLEDGTFRGDSTDENFALDYGYSILASTVAKEIVAFGYAPQLGIHHKSEQNPLNLAYDIVEPLRLYVDRMVFMRKDLIRMDSATKHDLLGLLNQQVIIEGKLQFLKTAIRIYVNSVLRCLDGEREDISFIDR